MPSASIEAASKRISARSMTLSPDKRTSGSKAKYLSGITFSSHGGVDHQFHGDSVVIVTALVKIEIVNARLARSGIVFEDLEIVLRDADHSVHRLVDDVIVAAPYGSQQKQEAYRKILHRNRIIKVSNRDSARGCS